MITGTTSGSGTFNFSVRLTDSTAEAISNSFSIIVKPAAIPPGIDTTLIPDATVGDVYSRALSASSGTPPYSWSLVSGSLPAGLVLSAAGLIQGVPSSTGSFNFIVTVTDSAAATATVALSIDVLPGPALPTTTAPPVSTAAQPGGFITLLSGLLSLEL